MVSTLKKKGRQSRLQQDLLAKAKNRKIEERDRWVDQEEKQKCSVSLKKNVASNKSGNLIH